MLCPVGDNITESAILWRVDMAYMLVGMTISGPCFSMAIGSNDIVPLSGSQVCLYERLRGNQWLRWHYRGITSHNFLTNPNPGTLIRCFNLASVGSTTLRDAMSIGVGGSVTFLTLATCGVTLPFFLITGHNYESVDL